MEPEGSLPHWQQSATCPHPQPDRFSQCPQHTSWRFILILSSHLRLGVQSALFSSGYPPKPCTYLSFPRMCYMARQSLSLRFDNLYNICWGVQIIKILIMKFSPLPCYLVPLRPKYSPQHPILNILNLRFSLNVIDQISHPFKTTDKTL